MIAASLATGLAAIGVIWAIGQTGSVLFVAAAVYGALCFTIHPLSASQVNDRAAPDQLVQVSAGLLLAYGIGASIGPIIAAQSMAVFGPIGFFLFAVGINCALILFTTIRIIQRRPGEKAKAPFMPLGGVGVSSRQLYTAAIISAEQDKSDDS